MRPIRVLVVDDSIVFRELLVHNLCRDPAVQVIATAKDPFAWMDFGQGNRLIEILKKYADSARQKAGCK